MPALAKTGRAHVKPLRATARGDVPQPAESQRPAVVGTARVMHAAPFVSLPKPDTKKPAAALSRAGQVSVGSALMAREACPGMASRATAYSDDPSATRS